MAKSDLEKRTVDDPDAAEWHVKAKAKWDAATDLATVTGGEVLDFYDPEPLPDFRAKAPAHVKRADVLGRFVVDRDTLVVHDVYAATPACGIDGIRNGTFFHFWPELLEAAGEESPCAECLA